MTLNERYHYVDMDSANDVCKSSRCYWTKFWSMLGVVLLHSGDRLITYTKEFKCDE